MDDGSSDRTAAIVESFAAEYPFIHLQSAGARGGRNFGSQYKAVMAAYDLAKTLEFDFVGVQDADQSPEREDYYELILQEFERNPKLGMASGYLYERWRGTWECRQGNSGDAVTGGMALFRRIAFDGIGGYTPLHYGGSDTLAQFELERASWETLTRPDLHIYHYRPTCSAGGIWRGLFRAGLEDASLGYHPVFEMIRCLRRLFYRPILGSVVRFCGYFWWKASGRKPLVEAETLAFIRKRQIMKLRRWALPIGKRPGKSFPVIS
jgi:glycosyltransferase involved in cell wall biosynthesis